ncbi:hypothetical protein QBC44DRAFT_324224 [Cladorrhinum sp. PSN332]|nr:hypothetical protein QBC44DRAFT_324224 [Cladorrhinum sp. PSN332]
MDITSDCELHVVISFIVDDDFVFIQNDNHAPAVSPNPDACISISHQRAYFITSTQLITQRNTLKPTTTIVKNLLPSKPNCQQPVTIPTPTLHHGAHPFITSTQLISQRTLLIPTKTIVKNSLPFNSNLQQPSTITTPTLDRGARPLITSTQLNSQRTLLKPTKTIVKNHLPSNSNSQESTTPNVPLGARSFLTSTQLLTQRNTLRPTKTIVKNLLPSNSNSQESTPITPPSFHRGAHPFITSTQLLTGRSTLKPTITAVKDHFTFLFQHASVPHSNNNPYRPNLESFISSRLKHPSLDPSTLHRAIDHYKSSTNKSEDRFGELSLDLSLLGWDSLTQLYQLVVRGGSADPADAKAGNNVDLDLDLDKIMSAGAPRYESGKGASTSPHRRQHEHELQASSSSQPATEAPAYGLSICTGKRPSPGQAKVLYPFRRPAESEIDTHMADMRATLSITAGEEVVIKKNLVDRGWCYVENKRGEKGWVPFAYLEEEW